MDGLRNAAYTGRITIDDLKKSGDFALGTFNYLDGTDETVASIQRKILDIRKKRELSPWSCSVGKTAY